MIFYRSCSKYSKFCDELRQYQRIINNIIWIYWNGNQISLALSIYQMKNNETNPENSWNKQFILSLSTLNQTKNQKGNLQKREDIDRSPSNVNGDSKIQQRRKGLSITQKGKLSKKPNTKQIEVEKREGKSVVKESQHFAHVQQRIKVKLEEDQTSFEPIEQHPKMRLKKLKLSGLKVAAIIVTFCGGDSFDDLFSKIQQKTMKGTQVLVYSCDSTILPEMLKVLQDGYSQIPILHHLLNELKEIDKDCVVFNWECCENYVSSCFYEGKTTLYTFLKFILDQGFMAMFSDFSLKALIKNWDSFYLGGNPFVQVGAHIGESTLKFRPEELKNCPSAQLNLVGDLSQKGRCRILCMQNTILYSVNPKNIDKSTYGLQVLSIHLSNKPISEGLVLQMDGERGTAGHVLLRYNSGGCLLTSMGHWAELMKIDTSEQKFFQSIYRNYGKETYERMRNESRALYGDKLRQYIDDKSVFFIQSQAPCRNMNFKKKN